MRRYKPDSALGQVADVLLMATVPLNPRALYNALPHIRPVTIRSAIWKLRDIGLVTRVEWGYRLTERPEPSRTESIQLLRLDPVGKLALIARNSGAAVTVHLTADQAAAYARELMDFARGQRKAGVAPPAAAMPRVRRFA